MRKSQVVDKPRVEERGCRSRKQLEEEEGRCSPCWRERRVGTLSDERRVRNEGNEKGEREESVKSKIGKRLRTRRDVREKEREREEVTYSLDYNPS